MTVWVGMFDTQQLIHRVGRVRRICRSPANKWVNWRSGSWAAGTYPTAVSTENCRQISRRGRFHGKATCNRRSRRNLGPFATAANVLLNTTRATWRGVALPGMWFSEPGMWFSEDDSKRLASIGSGPGKLDLTDRVLAVRPAFWGKNLLSISFSGWFPADRVERQASEHLVDLPPRTDIDDCSIGYDSL